MVRKTAAFEVLVFAVAILATISVAASYPSQFGHPEFSPGSLFERLALGTLGALPFAVVSTIGYGVARLLNHWKRYPGLVRVGLIGIVCGVLFFAWEMALSDNTFERTVMHGGRAVLAMDCVLGGAQWRSWPAAQLSR